MAAAGELPMNEEADDEPVRRMDPEIRVMNQIQKLLMDLDAPARYRVVAYLSARAAANDARVNPNKGFGVDAPGSGKGV